MAPEVLAAGVRDRVLDQPTNEARSLDGADALALAQAGRSPAAWAQLPQAMARGDVAALADYSPAQAIAALPDHELLEAIGRKRGAVMSGGRVNLQKAAELVLTDFRSAVLGRITLETPQEFDAWLAVGQAQEAERKARKEEQERRRKRRNKDD